jgi:RNA polymerase sigma-70 factor (ECF subfamily)
MPDLNLQLVDQLPHLKRFALTLTRNPDTAGDLVQDCVERAIRKAGTFEPGTNLRAWLFTMMRNQFINGARRRLVAHRYVERRMLDAPQSSPPVQLISVLLGQTMTALKGLGAEERQVVEMIALANLTHQEAADMLGIPTGTTKSRLFRGRTQLQAMMAPSGGRVLDNAPEGRL